MTDTPSPAVPNWDELGIPEEDAEPADADILHEMAPEDLGADVTEDHAP